MMCADVLVVCHGNIAASINDSMSPAHHIELIYTEQITIAVSTCGVLKQISLADVRIYSHAIN